MENPQHRPDTLCVSSSGLPEDMRPRSPPFPAPLLDPHPTDVREIVVEEVLDHADRFGARISHPSLKKTVLDLKTVSLNAVLNGDAADTAFSPASWEAVEGLKYWGACCARTSLGFLFSDTTINGSRWAPSGNTGNAHITRPQLLALQAWGREMFETFSQFRVKYGRHLVKRLRFSRDHFENGNIRLDLLKGSLVKKDPFSPSVRRQITDMAQAIQKAVDKRNAEEAAVNAQIAVGREREATLNAELEKPESEAKAEDVDHAASSVHEDKLEHEEDWVELPANVEAEADWVVI